MRLSRLRTAGEVAWDIVRRVWYQSADDNVLFLASGLAFNVLLALVPFVLVLISGIAWLLGTQPDQAAQLVTDLLRTLLPPDAPGIFDLLQGIVNDVLRTRGTVGIYSAIVFAWFSTRLFGSLRSVLALIFDGQDRGIVAGKIFDLLATLVATAAVCVYLALSAYLDFATSTGVTWLERAGFEGTALTRLEYVGGRLLAEVVIFALFWALYRGLPRRRPAWRTAAVAAGTTTILVELARNAYAGLLMRADLSSLYTGTIAVIVSVVFWTYYGALLFLIGGELAQATELRRAELARLTPD